MCQRICKPTLISTSYRTPPGPAPRTGDEKPDTEPAFLWGPEFMTGLADVDDQHRELVNIINAIGESISEGSRCNPQRLSTLFGRLRNYTVFHFAEEEAMMVRAQLDPRHLAEHQQEHRGFVAALERAQANGQGFDTADSMLRFLTSWLIHHILGRDQSMARQIAQIEAGGDPAEAHLGESTTQSDATGPLLKALHVLFRQVAERNDRLLALNQSLEQRVADRTSELTCVVEKLEQEKAASQLLGVELSRANRHLEAMAMTDVLTGLPNRRHAIAQLERGWRESSESGCTMSVIMVDADGFKTVNDTFGHDAGDAVLTTLAKELRNAVRTDDIVCRMGGDEFLIACPRTPLHAARSVAENTWRRVNALRVKMGDGVWRGSISVGVAQRTPEMGDIAALIKAADEAVYAAKNAGRNCVRSAGC